jgi:glycosyltransferase involved in cell wall biosynthesis
VLHVQHVWSVAKAAVSAGVRPVVTCHGSELDAAMRSHQSSALFIPDPGELGTIIMISDYVYGRARAVFGSELRALVLPNPCDTELFHPSDTPRPRTSPLLGFVGRLVAYKRCELYLEGLAELRTRHPAVTGVVIGDGPLATALRQRASDLGLGSVVVFTGQVAQGELPGWYAQMDAVVVPSHNEPFGLVALEAVACGTRAVVAAEGGLLELAHAPFIVAVDVTSADALGLTFDDVLRHRPDHADALAGYDWVRSTFSLDRYLSALEGIYGAVGV